MDKQQFLEQVLGDEGFYCIVGLKDGTDSRPVQKFFPRISDAVAVAENLVSEGYDAFYALATFEDGTSRRGTNVKQLRSLFVDLDCGPDKPYESQDKAIIALREFCSAVGLPRPTIVNSGGGIHGYWPISEPITKEQWLPLAEKLKSLCEDHDLHADPVVTADSVRILRVPGTINFKHNQQRPVSILRDGKVSTYEQLKGIIGEPIAAPKSFIPRGELDDVTKAILGNYTNRFKNIMVKTLKGDGCNQIKYIVENQTTMSEPMWRAGLSVAKFCIDAEKAIEKISSKHPDYDPDMAERKVRNIKGGPYTCAKFEEFNPGGCKDCTHKGQIKSPIVLGREVQEATEADNIVESVPENVDQGHTQTYFIPKYPDPYFRGKGGGIFKRVVKQEDEIEVMVYHNDMYVSRRLIDSDVGEAVVVKLHLPRDGVREFTMPLSAAMSKDELRKHMSSHGVAMVKTDELMHYITAWVNKMQYESKADMARRQFGWTDEHCTAFVLGDREITADRVDHNPPSSATVQLMPAFQPKGDIDTWKEAMRFYNRPGMEMHQFVIGLAFGSIFTKFTPVNASLLHIFSPESGIGKTTSLLAGCSIWGDPTKLLLKEADTTASKMNRAELYNNLWLPMDELTNSTAKECSDFLYMYTSGQQRNRMSQHSNQERHRGEIWKQQGVSTGNSSMVEKMSAYKAMPKGEATRVLEVRAHPIPGLDKATTDWLSETLISNYGVAAIPYLQFVMKDIQGVKSLFKTTQGKLDKLLELDPSDRFHSVQAACGITGLMMAKYAGLIDFEIKPVIDWLRGVIKGTKVQAKSMDSDAETSLSNFMAENWNNILRIKSTDDARSLKKDDIEQLIIPDATPRATFVARYEYDIKVLYIYLSPLREWCVKRQINYEGFVDSLRRGRSKARIEKKRMGKGTRMSIPPLDVLCVDCSEFISEEVEDELASVAEHANAKEGDI